ncbi:MAG: L,D-transpeptidase family protein [Myxococcaceae bacterium]|nr:L,D-transpeptidase family protein [Myxococcaceae bacterium]
MAGALIAATLVCCAEGRAQDRVKAARAARMEEIHALFDRAHLAYPAKEIYLRAFKREGEVELWGAPRAGAPMVLLKRYSICMSSGGLGPKRERGDGQVPEGFYEIDRFNPWSNFHLSLGVSYPNASDRIRGKKNPGGDIFIHGSCVTVGCIPLRDGPIEELYLIALDARSYGQRRIRVDIFPTRMDAEGMAYLSYLARDRPELMSFWRELEPGYLAFEKSRRPPMVTVGKGGAYVVRPVAAW